MDTKIIKYLVAAFLVISLCSAGPIETFAKTKDIRQIEDTKKVEKVKGELVPRVYFDDKKGVYTDLSGPEIARICGGGNVQKGKDELYALAKAYGTVGKKGTKRLTIPQLVAYWYEQARDKKAPYANRVEYDNKTTDLLEYIAQAYKKKYGTLPSVSLLLHASGQPWEERPFTGLVQYCYEDPTKVKLNRVKLKGAETIICTGTGITIGNMGGEDIVLEGLPETADNETAFSPFEDQVQAETEASPYRIDN